jgi:putative protein kinase ArgK-like GTPase of G3E family
VSLNRKKIPTGMANEYLGSLQTLERIFQHKNEKVHFHGWQVSLQREPSVLLLMELTWKLCCVKCVQKWNKSYIFQALIRTVAVHQQAVNEKFRLLEEHVERAKGKAEKKKKRYKDIKSEIVTLKQQLSEKQSSSDEMDKRLQQAGSAVGSFLDDRRKEKKLGANQIQVGLLYRKLKKARADMAEKV